MQVQFTCSLPGRSSWIAELPDLSERVVIEEFIRQVPGYSPKDLQIMWIEKNYLGRIWTHTKLIGRFWEALDDQRAIKHPVVPVKVDRETEKKAG